MNIVKSNASSIKIYLFSTLCLACGFAFVVYHLLIPSDGARLSTDLSIFTAQGVRISVFESFDGPLAEGDIVTAVNGTAVETWARGLFTGGVVRPDWKTGETVAYEVLRNGQLLEVDVRLNTFPLSDVLRSHWGALLFALVSQVVAVFVYLNRREDRTAQALVIWAMSGSHTYAWSVFLQVGDIVDGAGFWLFRIATPLLWLIYWPASTHVAMVFPRPLRLVRKYPVIIPGVYVLSFLLFLVLAIWNWFQAENILLWLNSWGPIDSVIAAVFLLTTMVTVLVQYRRGWTGVERQQIRWTIFGALVSGLGGLVLWVIYPLLTGRSAIDANLLGLLALPFPVALAMAIWRHRLFDIDIIIRRTLQYSVVTVLLAGVYYAGVILLQAMLQVVTGSSDSTLVTVITTLGIAALFNPLRARVQVFIERRFYRTSYDAEQILSHLAATARDEVDLESLSIAILGAIDESMQPEHVSLWIRPITE